jgi:threonine dehydrogenase-like Zn-dependent dehydrogenase
MIKAVGLLPDAVARPLMTSPGFDRLAALHASIECGRRGGAVSLLGVYGSAADPMPLMQRFDRGLCEVPRQGGRHDQGRLHP